MRRALAIDEKSFGPEHPNVARDPQQPWPCLLEEHLPGMGKSEALKRRALAIDEKSFGPDHPKVAIRLNNLAALLSGHQPGRRGGAVDAPRAGHR